MPFEFNRPSTPDQQAPRAAESLHEWAFAGNPAESKMSQEVAQLNHEFAGNKGMLAQIAQQYKALSKNDALFASEVNIGKDGSLTFTPNTVISHELRDYSSKAAKELKALHKIESKMGKEKDEGRRKDLIADKKNFEKMMKQSAKTQQSMEHEEHLLAAAPMNPNGEAVTPGQGYSAAQRTAMQNLVDTSLAQSGSRASDSYQMPAGGGAATPDYDFYGLSNADNRAASPAPDTRVKPATNAIVSEYESRDLDVRPYDPNYGSIKAKPFPTRSTNPVSSGDWNGYVFD
jgi:hypothetical protein